MERREETRLLVRTCGGFCVLLLTKSFLYYLPIPESRMRKMTTLSYDSNEVCSRDAPGIPVDRLGCSGSRVLGCSGARVLRWEMAKLLLLTITNVFLQEINHVPNQQIDTHIHDRTPDLSTSNSCPGAKP